jgi:hypothetical protein
VETILKYNTVGTILKYNTVGTILKYNTVGTILKYNTQIKRCFGILFGLCAQENMAFIFDINTHLNEIYKEMS